MSEIIVKQYELQSKGGLISRCPASYTVFTILNKYSLFQNVLDVTYGEGRFYMYKKPNLLIGSDVKVWNWVVDPDIFIRKPVWHLEPILKKLNVEFNVLVCDPPAWNKDVKYNKREPFSYIIGTPELIIEEAFKLAEKLGIKYLLLHFNRVLEDKKIIMNVKFNYATRYLNNPSMTKTSYFTLYTLNESDPEEVC